MVSVAKKLSTTNEFNPLVLGGGLGCLGASLYILLFDCASCTSFDTGVPTTIKSTLSGFGVLYGLINLFGSRKLTESGEGLRPSIFPGLVIAVQLLSILVLGWLVAIAASGVWRLCPFCKVFWGFNLLLILSASFSSVREARWTIPTLVVAIGVAASPIAFPDVKQILTGYVPRESLLVACDALNGRSIVSLEPIQHQNLILVGDCAPCARQKVQALFRTLNPTDYEIISHEAWTERLPDGWKMTIKPNLFSVIPELDESKGAFVVTIKEHKVESCRRVN